jgi:hypothetical protein
MSYGWGDDTSVSSTSGGYDYTSARRAYTSPSTSGSSGRSTSSGRSRSSGRTYASVDPVGPDYPLNKDVETESTSPLVVAIDVTGSMAEWPETFFEKLPLLYNEVKRYIPDVEISFAAVGDAYTDSYPIQIGDFAKGKSLDAKINDIYPEGGGGGGARESYSLTAQFYNEHCKMPNAKNPIFVFLGDEGYYPNIPKAHIREYIGDDVGEAVKCSQVMDKLKSNFKVYAVRKEYFGNEEEVREQWENTLGRENVVMLEDPGRVVDCIIGLVASYAGKFDDFSKRLSTRQTKDQTSAVMGSLHHIDKGTSLDAAVSLKKLPKGRRAKKLTD